MTHSAKLRALTVRVLTVTVTLAVTAQLETEDHTVAVQSVSE